MRDDEWRGMMRVPVSALALAMLTSFAMAAPAKLTDAQFDRITGGSAVPPPQQPCNGAFSCFAPSYGTFTAFNTGVSPVNGPAPGKGISSAIRNGDGYPISLGTATAFRGSPYPL